MISAAWAMSSALVLQPRLMRSELRASAALRPIAISTCDGSTAPAVQAGPIGNFHALKVERNQHAFAEHAWKSEVKRIPDTPLARTVQAQARDRRDQVVTEKVGQGPDSRTLMVKRLGHRDRGGTEADRSNQVGRAGAQPTLLRATEQGWREAQARADEERANPRGPANLVRAKRHQIAAQILNSQLNPTGSLRRVEMEDGAHERGPPRDRRNLHDGAYFGVHESERHQRDALVDRGRDCVRINPAVAVGSEANDFKALAFKLGQRRDYGRVLDRGSNDTAPVAASRPGRA